MERMFSFPGEFGQWDPGNQRPELWALNNGCIHRGELLRMARRHGDDEILARLRFPLFHTGCVEVLIGLAGWVIGEFGSAVRGEADNPGNYLSLTARAHQSRARRPTRRLLALIQIQNHPHEIR
jgi:hypothetical protein